MSDTVFISEYKNYDVIVGMYHDQVLSPFKTLYKYDGVNVTLGLKYLRVSPDHGTAKELIGKKVAKDTSLTRCIKFVNKFKNDVLKKVSWTKFFTRSQYHKENCKSCEY